MFSKRFVGILVIGALLLWAGARLLAQPEPQPEPQWAEFELPVPPPVVTPTPAFVATAVPVQTVDSDQIDVGGGPEHGPESGGGLPDIGGGAPETEVYHVDGSRHCLANCPRGNFQEPIEGVPMGQRAEDPNWPDPIWETRADGVTVCTGHCGGSDSTVAGGDQNRGGGFQPPEQ